MTTWETTSDYYKKVFDVLHEYANTSFKTVQDDSVAKNISIHIMEKLHINMIAAIDLIEECKSKPILFLPLGLVLRGIISDLINYRYLIEVRDNLSNEDFENEAKVLDLDFVKGYKRMVENEEAIHAAEAEKVKEIDSAFKNHFPEFHKGDTLKNESDFRRSDFKDLMKDYLKLIGQSSININTEAGKIKFVRDQHVDRIALLYTYLSQLQHFSGRAYNFYKSKDYIQGNPHFTLMLLFYIALTLTKIMSILSNDSKYVGKLVELITEMNKE